MTGVESFVLNNFSNSNSKFDSCLQIVIYGYLLLQKSKTYSRKEIQNTASLIRGKKAKSIELEDYLRNDLVTNYINPNRSLFGLTNYLFVSGAEEFSENVKIGVLDIKVCSPLLNGDTYFVFECKRLNRKLIDKYIKEGVHRFVSGQYYPKSKATIGGMISFLESTDSKDRIVCTSSFNTIESALKKFKNEINLEGNLHFYKFPCDSIIEIESFEYTFLSRHKKSQDCGSIELYHVVLDYNNLITS